MEKQNFIDQSDYIEPAAQMGMNNAAGSTNCDSGSCYSCGGGCYGCKGCGGVRPSSGLVEVVEEVLN